jgi:hypothetical protein
MAILGFVARFLAYGVACLMATRSTNGYANCNDRFVCHLGQTDYRTT